MVKRLKPVFLEKGPFTIKIYQNDVLTVISLHKPCRNFHLGIHYTLNGVSTVNNNNNYYYSLKIFSISDWLKPHALFLRFWLAKTSRIIHHNQLLLTKYGRNLQYVKNNVKSAVKLPDCWTFNWEDLWTRSSCFGCDFKMAGHFPSFKSKKYANYWLQSNIARTPRSQTNGQHLLFGGYLHTWTTLYLLNLPINVHFWRWS